VLFKIVFELDHFNLSCAIARLNWTWKTKIVVNYCKKKRKLVKKKYDEKI